MFRRIRHTMKVLQTPPTQPEQIQPIAKRASTEQNPALIVLEVVIVSYVTVNLVEPAINWLLIPDRQTQSILTLVAGISLFSWLERTEWFGALRVVRRWLWSLDYFFGRRLRETARILKK